MIYERKTELTSKIVKLNNVLIFIKFLCFIAEIFLKKIFLLILGKDKNTETY